MPRKRAGGTDPGNTEKGRPRFPPFRGPHYTMVPDEVFDVLLPELNGSELKALLYIIRRTFGFKKDADQISLSQMLTGITTRDGRVLDRGVGLSKGSLLPALRNLEEMGLITTERRQSAERGHEPTSYSLNVSEAPPGLESRPPLVQKLRQGGGAETVPSPWYRNSTTQETVEQETVEQETDFENSNIRMISPGEEGEAQRPQAVVPASGTDGPAGSPESVGEVLERRGRRSQPRPETEDEDWQRILDYVIDFGRLFGDTAPTKASATRAYRLFKRSGRTAEAFVEVMYQARSITQERTASITKTAEDPAYGAKRKTKMAYFFAVLEDQLGLVSPEDRARRGKGGDGGTREQEPQSRPGRAKETGQEEGTRRPARGRDSDGPYADYVKH